MTMDAQNKDLNGVFNICYDIDFYQREYKWKKEHVKSLLEDIFFKFNIEYDPKRDVTVESVAKYGWYYLNTFVTNKSDGRIYIVDGQQRLTTVTLILIKLYHMAKDYETSDENLEKTTKWIEAKICGFDWQGPTYWMGALGRHEVLDDLLHQKQHESKDYQELSLRNMVDNFDYIKAHLENELCNAHKLLAFVFFFLQKVQLVQIQIGNFEDVPMVFEVINDRGEQLKPYEVFKGSLLGQLDKNDVKKYYDIWSEHTGYLENMGEAVVDAFFRYYFRAKHASASDYKEIEGDYHRTVFSKEWGGLRSKDTPSQVKRFIENEFAYFASKYGQWIEYNKKEVEPYPHMFYNALNEQNRQLMLVMSALSLNDTEETQKVQLVTRLLDRHFSLLQLMGCYDSHSFDETIIYLNEAIRNKGLADIETIFDQRLLKDISADRGIELQNTGDWFHWPLFNETGIQTFRGTRFIRYFFARIDKFIASHTGIETNDYNNLVKNAGEKFGFQIEHILGHNDYNKTLFPTEEDFYRERNRLGALLLVRAKDNQAMGKKEYEFKLPAYEHQTLWAQTLTSGFYQNHKEWDNFRAKFNLNIRHEPQFDGKTINERQRLLFDMTKLIWG